MHRAALVLALTFAASSAAAQEHAWIARFQAGGATIHDWAPSGFWAEARLGRSFAGGVLSADLGLAFSGSDEAFGSLTVGVEALPLPKAVVSPFARVEAGFLGEPEYSGYVVGIGGGLAVRVGDRLSLRGGATWGTHGDVEGPVTYYGGAEIRW
jgi:hypothetical protein